MEPSYYQKEYSSKMEHSYQNGTHISKWNSSKWNTHQTWNSLKRNIHIIALWCTYNNLVTVRYVFGRNLRSSLLLAKVCIFLTEKETHQNGILIKMEYSYYQNGTLILKKEHSYYQKEHSYQKGTNRNTRLGSRPILCRQL